MLQTPDSAADQHSAAIPDSTGKANGKRDIPPSHLNPIVATERVDPDKENSKLRGYVLKKEKHIAQKVVGPIGFVSTFMKPLKKKGDDDEDDFDVDYPAELQQVEPLNLVTWRPGQRGQQRCRR